jgi:hypothetical protein
VIEKPIKNTVVPIGKDAQAAKEAEEKKKEAKKTLAQLEIA